MNAQITHKIGRGGCCLAVIATFAVNQAQAVEPFVEYSVKGGKLILTYSGKLQESTDCKTWTASSIVSGEAMDLPKTGEKFFRAIGETEPKAGDVQTFTLPQDVKLEMVYCPAGTFMMGSPEDELGRYDDETQHEVTLTESFWIGKTPITQVQYKAITGENPAEKDYGVGDNNPIYNVSWHDCVAFCEKLNQLKIAPSGYRFALPTEAQWEYACRAGTTTALNNGKPIISEDGECPNLDEVGWYLENADYDTRPVGEKQPNAWGIYDMHGNIWEWCADWYGDYPAGAVTNPMGPETGEYCVLRGGSWYDFAGSCRSAIRGISDPNNYGGDGGFRLALISE